MKKAVSRPYLMMLASMLIWGSIGVFRRSIPLSSAVLACARGLLGSLCLLAFMALRKRKQREKLSRRSLLLLVISGGLIGLNWILLFEAYRFTTVAKATLSYYMAPTLVVLLSVPVLKERLTGRRLICVLAALIGMALVAGVTDLSVNGATDARGLLLGLGAAFLYACVVLLNKKLTVADAYLKTVLQLLSAALAVVPYLLATEDLYDLAGALTGRTPLLLLLVGVVHTGIAYALYFGSLADIPAQSAALLSYLDPVAALLFSALLLKEPLTLPAALGAVLIIGSALFGEKDK